MNKLPDGWKFVKLSDIANISAGGTPRINVQEYWEDGVIPWLKISDLKNTYINYAEEKITQKGLDDSSAKIFPKGTVVYSIFATLGAVGILEMSAATNQAIAGIIPNNSLIDTKYLYHCLQSEKNNILAKKSHATRDNINLTILRNHEIPLPPLPAQKKIAAVLEKAEKLREWRKEADGLTDRFLKSTFLEMFGDTLDNPKGWDIVTLKNVCDKITDGTHHRPTYIEKGVPFLSVKNITNGYLDLSDIKYISLEEHEKLIRRCKPEEGDILYTKVGVNYGIAELVSINTEFSIYVSLALLKPNHKIIDSKFFKYVLNSNYVKRQAIERISGIGVPDLHLVEIKQIKIPLPPLPLQQKFASIVHQIEQIRQQQEQSKQQIDHFFNVLMQKAFNGELEA